MESEAIRTQPQDDTHSQGLPWGIVAYLYLYSFFSNSGETVTTVITN